MVSGLAALYLQKYPTATPDQVKAALMNSATAPNYVKKIFAGLGVPDVNKAIDTPLPAAALAAQLPTGATRHRHASRAARGSATCPTPTAS